jgi:WhiB family transcriptional regulator, redox-sensing transcriptional regulator
MERAACAGMPLDVFFPVAAGPGQPPDWTEARTVCGRCEVAATCLQYAQTARLEHGMLAGLTPEERKARRRAAA